MRAARPRFELLFRYPDFPSIQGNVEATYPGVHFVYFLLRQFEPEVEYDFECTKNYNAPSVRS